MLVRRHWDGAHRVAFLVVRDAAAAEDIAQEALLAAVDAIDRFDRRRPFGPWLHRIVVNRSLDWLRAAKRRPEVVVEGSPEPEVEHALHDAGPEQTLPGELSDALGKLDPDSRAALVLRHVLGYRSPEIAVLLNLPASTVRTRVERGLDRLRELLEQPTGGGGGG